MTKRTLTRRAFITTAAAATWLGLLPNTAHADTQSDLEAARQHLDTLGAGLASLQGELEAATCALETTASAIDDKQQQIEQTQADLAEKRATLGDRMRSSYKSGPTEFLDFVLGATSAEDLVSRIYYMDKVTESDAAAIEDVRTLEAQLETEMGELEDQQADQQQQVDDMRDQVATYESQVAEARAYYNQLDAEVQAELQRQAQEAAAAAAENGTAQTNNVATVVGAIDRAEQVEQLTGNANTSQNITNPPVNPPASTGGSSNTGTTTQPSTPATPDPEPETSTPSGGGSQPYGGAGVSSAYSCLGWPYVYGGASPASGGFDCSGLVCYCYGWKYGHSSAAMKRGIAARGELKTSISELSYGDLVFTNGDGHVGIYVGGGQMIHASGWNGQPVILGAIYGFCGGGPY